MLKKGYKPRPVNKIRCPTCFAFDSPQVVEKVWNRHAHMYEDRLTYVKPDCPDCAGTGLVPLGRTRASAT